MSDLSNYEAKMDKSISAVEHNLSSIRAGRANPAVLDKIKVDYYSTPTPINQVAAISTPEARTLCIQPWDQTLVSAIEKAILASDIGINPVSDGKVLRLNFPQPTEERRRELVKDVKKMGEDGKVAIRSVRRDAIDTYKKMEKAHEITEDDLKQKEDEIQKLTDKFCKKIDDLIAEKEKEVMAI